MSKTPELSREQASLSSGIINQKTQTKPLILFCLSLLKILKIISLTPLYYPALHAFSKYKGSLTIIVWLPSGKVCKLCL